jgi:hypothetical protein
MILLAGPAQEFVSSILHWPATSGLTIPATFLATADEVIE